MSDLSWTLLSEQSGYDGFTKVARRTYRMPDGALAEWDVVCGTRTVAVLARTVDGRFVTVRQFRPGPGRVLHDLPGGGVEDGESVAEAAARELAEETGYVAGELHVVGRSWLAASAQVEQFCVVATDCTLAGSPSPDPLEFLEVELATTAELLDVVRRGDLTDAGIAYRGLDFLGLLRSA